MSTPAESPRYFAFISYSHQDEAWAQWLHKTLETWRVPRAQVRGIALEIQNRGASPH